MRRSLASILSVVSVSRRELIAKLILYSVAFGALHVNYIDLVVPGSQVPGYHLWLVVHYFVPFLTVVLLFGARYWDVTLALGLLASLMNDLLYFPVGNLLLGRNYDLLDCYLFQLGFKDGEVRWRFNGGFFTVPVSSWLMAFTIYARIVAVALLTHRSVNTYAVGARNER